MASTASRCRGALLGLAVGDALATTVEFSPRGTAESSALVFRPEIV